MMIRYTFNHLEWPSRIRTDKQPLRAVQWNIGVKHGVVNYMFGQQWYTLYIAIVWRHAVQIIACMNDVYRHKTIL